MVLLWARGVLIAPELVPGVIRFQWIKAGIFLNRKCFPYVSDSNLGLQSFKFLDFILVSLLSDAENLSFE